MNTNDIESCFYSLILDITSEIQDQAWNQSNYLSSPSNRQRAYINLLSQRIIFSYLQEEIDSVAIEFADNQSHFWELGVNGNAVMIDGNSEQAKRLVIIPSEKFSLETLEVPQEWIDIPQLAGDYFLGVKVDTEATNNIIGIWGYATHRELKEKGYYSKISRNYFLSGDQINQELNTLLLMREYCPEEITQSEITPIPLLQEDRSTELLTNILANKELIFPRQAVNFAEWGAIFGDSIQRQILVDRRQSINISDLLKNSSATNQVDDSQQKELVEFRGKQEDDFMNQILLF